MNTQNSLLAADRKTVLAHILTDLESMKTNGFLNQYAIDELIHFFHAIQSWPKYLFWLFGRARTLDRARLLELTDLPFPRWDREMHLKLMEVESRDFPGLITPLVDRVVDAILQKGSDPFVTANLGCGGMEVERQILKRLHAKKHSGQVVFIGFDISATVHEIAKDNLRNVESDIVIHEVASLDSEKLVGILAQEKKRHVVILAKNDIFALPNHFKPGAFDVMYHTLFKHHLTAQQKENIDSVIEQLTRFGIEYDGYKSWPHILIPHTLTAWKYPAYFNGTIFSDFRYFTKQELRQQSRVGWSLKIFPVGTYLKEYKS